MKSKQKKRPNLLMHTAVQTPEGIKQYLIEFLGEIAKAYDLETPVLSYDVISPCETLVWMVRGRSKNDKAETCFCFYPQTGLCLQKKAIVHLPVTEVGKIFSNGNVSMEVVKIEGEISLQLSGVCAVIEYINFYC